MSDGVDDEISYRFRWRLPDRIQSDARPVAEEIARRGRRNEDLGDRAEGWRRIWAALGYVLGAPAAVLAATSGYLALNDKDSTLAGVLALLSAAIGALLTFLDPTRRAATANARANTHWEISQKARFMLAAGLPRADAQEAANLLAQLQELEEAA